MIMATIIEAEYPYEYEDADGSTIEFKAGERFILLAKSSSDWWKVQRTGFFEGKSQVFVPVAYVREVNTKPKGEKSQHYVNLEVYQKLMHKDFEGLSMLDRQHLIRPKQTPSSSDPENENNPDDDKKVSFQALNDTPDYDDSDDDAFEMMHSSIDEIPEDLPLKSYNTEQESEQDLIPPGWLIEKEPGSSDSTYINASDPREKWKLCFDESGRRYYYNLDGSATEWELPAADKPQSRGRRRSFDEARDAIRRKTTNMQMLNSTSKFQPPAIRSSSSASNHSDDAPKSPSELFKTALSHQRTPSNQSLEEEGSEPVADGQEVVLAELEGYLITRKLVECRKPVRKSAWLRTYTIKFGSILFFYKDQKFASPKPGFPAGKPEGCLNLDGAKLEHVAKDQAKGKKNVFQITSSGGDTVLQFLADNGNMKGSWITAIQYAIQKMEEEDLLPAPPTFLDVSDGRTEALEAMPVVSQPLMSPTLPVTPITAGAKPTTLSIPKNLTLPVAEKDKAKKGFARRLSKRIAFSAQSSVGDEEKDKEKTKIKEKLKKYLTRRPSHTELEQKGIWMDEGVFGTHLHKVCELEGNCVPKFVVLCCNEVQKRGLEVDGIYRVSGNLAIIQKLRIMVDHDEYINFTQPPFDDIHIVAGALKLFFRELPEPLIPFNMFDKFISAMKSPFKQEKVKILKKLVHELPAENRDTLELLINHFTKVVANSSKNRMQAQNLSIVFGPTLMWPEQETSSLAVTTVYQNYVIDSLITSCSEIFT